MKELLGRLLSEAESAAALARAAGITEASLSLLLRGARKPTFETVQKLLKASGKPWAWLDENLVEVELDSRPEPGRGRGRPRKDESK